MAEQDEPRRLRDDAETRHFIEQSLNALFAPEDDALRAALEAVRAHDMPAIQILTRAGAALAGARARLRRAQNLGDRRAGGLQRHLAGARLPPSGRLISLEVSEKHAQAARDSLARADSPTAPRYVSVRPPSYCRRSPVRRRSTSSS